MTSNAFERSQKIDNVTCLGVELLANAQWFNKCIIGWIVECFSGKPYWCL